MASVKKALKIWKSKKKEMKIGLTDLVHRSNKLESDLYFFGTKCVCHGGFSCERQSAGFAQHGESLCAPEFYLCKLGHFDMTLTAGS